MRTAGSRRSAEVPSARIRPCVKSRQYAPGALSQTEHTHMNPSSTPPRTCAVWNSACRVRRSQFVMVSVAVIVLALSLQAVDAQGGASSAPGQAADDDAHSPTLEEAQRFFYNGDYDKAAALTQALCAARLDNLEACELRSASLLFQIKKAFGQTGERDKAIAWNRCAVCPGLMSAFLAETARSQALARARLTTDPDDEDTLFFLGKVDLNYVWLQLGTLGRKTGWDEYWEARRSLDRVLRINPKHVRARVARAWVDYIVGSTVPRGARWLLGGGNKKHGLLVVREVVDTGSGSFFVHTEAMFALWDMQVREREVPEAVATARLLVRDFPENRELRRFLTIHDSSAFAINPAHRVP